MSLETNINICSQCNKSTYSICLGCGLTMCDECRTDLLCNICKIDENCIDIKFTSECKINRFMEILSKYNILPYDVSCIRECLVGYADKNSECYLTCYEQFCHKITNEFIQVIEYMKSVLDGKDLFIDQSIIPDHFTIYKGIISNKFSIKT